MYIHVQTQAVHRGGRLPRDGPAACRRAHGRGRSVCLYLSIYLTNICIYIYIYIYIHVYICIYSIYLYHDNNNDMNNESTNDDNKHVLCNIITRSRGKCCAPDSLNSPEEAMYTCM